MASGVKSRSEVTGIAKNRYHHRRRRSAIPLGYENCALFFGGAGAGRGHVRFRANAKHPDGGRTATDRRGSGGRGDAGQFAQLQLRGRGDAAAGAVRGWAGHRGKPALPHPRRAGHTARSHPDHDHFRAGICRVRWPGDSHSPGPNGVDERADDSDSGQCARVAAVGTGRRVGGDDTGRGCADECAGAVTFPAHLKTPILISKTTEIASLRAASRTIRSGSKNFASSSPPLH